MDVTDGHRDPMEELLRPDRPVQLGRPVGDFERPERLAVHGHRRRCDDGGLDERTGCPTGQCRLDEMEGLAGVSVQHDQRGSMAGQFGPPVVVGGRRFRSLVDGDGLLEAVRAEQVLRPGHRQQDELFVRLGEWLGGGQDRFGLVVAAELTERVAQQVACRRAPVARPCGPRQQHGAFEVHHDERSTGRPQEQRLVAGVAQLEPPHGQSQLVTRPRLGGRLQRTGEALDPATPPQ